ncbi:MAG: hypothetical protein EB059_01825 [Alphaproteobacteria bacterium]|nr:hypothetical protein [Alphaproteobacteria bacterium]
MIAKICGAGSAIGSGIKRIMNCSAAEQLRGLIKAGCGIASSLIKSGQVAVGTVIGVCRSKIPAWAKGRWGGISHVGVVTEVNGKKYISESSGGGVKLTEYNTWVQKNDSGKLYAANPLLLVKDNGPNYSGYDGRKNNIAQVRTPYLAPAAKSHYASTHTHVTASLDNASPRSRSGSPFRYS